MERGGSPMPLTDFQRTLLATVAHDETGESYLAGGAAIHFAPNSTRYSNDLDFFHDSVERVASAFARDRARLEKAGYRVEVEISQPGFIRVAAALGGNSTRVDWAHDSAWRFMPLVRDEQGGLLLHSVDLAINKVLVLAGRDEPRDFVDILYVDAEVLPLGATVWAAAGKDPGFTPLSLLELLKRRGKYRSEDFARLDLAQPFDVVAGKARWLAMLEDAERFARARPALELGCLYWSVETARFVMPAAGEPLSGALVAHYGRPGGVMSQVRPG